MENIFRQIHSLLTAVVFFIGLIDSKYQFDKVSTIDIIMLIVFVN